MTRAFSLAVVMAVLSAGDRANGVALARIVVDSGKHERLDTPVCVALEGVADPWRPMQLVEVTGGNRRPVASQMEAGDPPVLWFILDGPTAQGSKRNYELIEGNPVAGPMVTAEMNGAALTVACSAGKVIRYNYEYVVPPQGVDGSYIRSGYIHPLWSPSGLCVTDDLPPEHLHHKGIWFPWTKTEFEGRHPDFWNLGGKTGTVRFAGFEAVTSGTVWGGFKSRHEHVDLSAPGHKVALLEQWDARVWNVGGPEKKYWLMDLTSRQRCATDSPLILPEYRYGGLGFRGNREWGLMNNTFLTSEGKGRLDGHATRAKWCDVAGTVGGKWTGAVIMGHPENFRFPEPMRIHPTEPFFCYAPSLAGDWKIEPGKEHVARYRFFVHDEKTTSEVAGRFWTDFGEPPEARIEK